jgi:hypothetical protein
MHTYGTQKATWLIDKEPSKSIKQDNTIVQISLSDFETDMPDHVATE